MMLAIKLRFRTTKNWYFIRDDNEWQVHYSNIRPGKCSNIRIFDHNIYFAILWLCLRRRFFVGYRYTNQHYKCLCVANVHVKFPIKFYVNILNFCFKRMSGVSKHLTLGAAAGGGYIGLCSCGVEKLLTNFFC